MSVLLVKKRLAGLLVIALVVLCFSVPARAAFNNVVTNEFDLGVISGTVEIGNYFPGFGERLSSQFEDTWIFEVAGPSDAVVEVDDFEVGFELLFFGYVKLLDLDNFEVLFDGQDVTVGEEVYFEGLSVGKQYSLILSGETAGLFGGAYNGEITVSAVPVPAAAIMFGSALAGLLLIRSKHRQRS